MCCDPQWSSVGAWRITLIAGVYGEMVQGSRDALQWWSVGLASEASCCCFPQRRDGGAMGGVAFIVSVGHECVYFWERGPGVRVATAGGLLG